MVCCEKIPMIDDCVNGEIRSDDDGTRTCPKVRETQGAAIQSNHTRGVEAGAKCERGRGANHREQTENKKRKRACKS